MTWSTVIAAFILRAILDFAIEGWERKSRRNAIAALPNFQPAIIEDAGKMSIGLAIDPNSKQFALLPKKQPPKLYAFSDLVAVEVQKNGQSLETTNRGSQIAGAAVGAVLLGPLGLLVGGLSGSKKKVETVRELSLKLYLTDLRHPVTELVFFKSSSNHKPTDFAVTEAAKRLDEWYGRLRTIVAVNERA